MDRLQQYTWPTVGIKKKYEYFPSRYILQGSFVPINLIKVLIEENFDKALRSKKLLIRGEEIELLTEIKNQLYEIKKELQSLRTSTSKEEILIFREISRENAKEEIKKYFSEHKNSEISYSDLVRDTKLDLKLIVDICSEMEAEGLIG